jgi:hypothetical protein
MLVALFWSGIGVEIDLSKFEIVPIGNVGDVEGLASILGCGVASLPIKYLDLPFFFFFFFFLYLDLPLSAHYKASTIWSSIIEKMVNKLMLIKSTLSNLPTYYLSLFPIPVGVANRF